MAAPPVSAVAPVSGPAAALSMVPAGHAVSSVQQASHKPASLKQQASTLEPGVALSHSFGLLKIEDCYNDHWLMSLSSWPSSCFACKLIH